VTRFRSVTIALIVLATPAVGQVTVTPNDPFFDRQVSFVSPGRPVTFDISSCRASLRTFDCSAGIDLNVGRAWALTTGSRDVIIAIIDDGFFYTHEDIGENIWANPGESGPDDRGYPRETNGRDDDGNGFVDDVVGWDFTFDDPDPDCYIFDGMLNTRIQPYWHSISAMGIIGAKGNNGVGVAGVNWSVSMMLLKIGMQGTWPREVADRAGKAARAIRYAADNGARVINWSGFLSKATAEDQATLKSAIDYAASKDVLLVLAAGNFGTDIDLPEHAVYPQCLDCDNILNVAEISFAGALDERSGRDRVSASCYGVQRVGVAALARNFTTDVRHARSTYSLGGGTSCAAPVVTGVAGLMLSVAPDLSYRQIKDIICRTARPMPALVGKVASGGAVDAYASVQAARQTN
jgi:subtilisin family serine protease